MDIRWLGTATVELACGESRLLVDPYFQKDHTARKRQNPAVAEAVTRADAILITHPHLDHFADIARLSRMTGVPIYVAPRGLQLAKKRGARMDAIHPVRHGDVLTVGRMTVRVWRSRHVAFDSALVKRTLRRAFQPIHFLRGVQIGLLNRFFRLTGEDVLAFEVSGAEKSVLVLGSANLCEDTAYPQGVDALLYPFQGRSDMNAYSEPILERLKPKRIVLTHFDDAFPPISERVDTRHFLKAHPNAMEPTFAETIHV